MKKILYISSIILFLSNILKAQEIELNWADKFGGPKEDYGNSIAVDDSGNVYTAGTFKGEHSFYIGTRQFKFTALYKDIFLLKHDKAGNLLWAKHLKGNRISEVNSISYDKSGNIFITGSFEGTVIFESGNPSVSISSYLYFGSYSTDIFIAKINSEAQTVWVKQLKSGVPSCCNSPQSISLLNDKSILIFGQFWHKVDFNPGIDTAFLTSTAQNDAFLLNLDSAGEFKWVKQFKGTNFVYGTAAETNSQNDIILVGTFAWTVDLNPDTSRSDTSYFNSGYGRDVYITKLDSSGAYRWGKLFKSDYFIHETGLVVDTEDNIIISGSFMGKVDFDPDTGRGDTFIVSGSMSNPVGFICKLNSEGNLLWIKTFEGLYNVSVSSVAVDSDNSVYCTGSFQKYADFDPGIDTFIIRANNSHANIFICKLSEDGNFNWATGILGEGAGYGTCITTDKAGNIYSTGTFGGNLDFAPGWDEFYLSASNSDAYILKLSPVTVGTKKHLQLTITNAYPNPSISGLYNIDLTENCTNLTATIRNIHGQVITTQRFSSSDQLQLQINGSAGIYFVELRTDDGKAANLKLIKL